MKRKKGRLNGQVTTREYRFAMHWEEQNGAVWSDGSAITLQTWKGVWKTIRKKLKG